MGFLQEVEEVVTESTMAFDDILSGPFALYLDLSRKIGGDVATQAEMVNEGFQAQRDYVQMASTCKAPSMENMMEVLAPTSEAIQSVQGFREQSRTSPYFNHLSAISERVQRQGQDACGMGQSVDPCSLRAAGLHQETPHDWFNLEHQRRGRDQGPQESHGQHADSQESLAALLQCRHFRFRG